MIFFIVIVHGEAVPVECYCYYVPGSVAAVPGMGVCYSRIRIYPHSSSTYLAGLPSPIIIALDGCGGRLVGWSGWAGE